MANQWRLALSGIDYDYGQWSECAEEIECNCGAKIILDTQIGSASCPSCGREYRLISRIEVRETGRDLAKL